MSAFVAFRSRATPFASRSFATTRPTPSHVGSAPIPYPGTVSFVPQPTPAHATGSLGDATSLLVQGPKGRLAINVPPFVHLSYTDAPRDGPSSSASASAVVSVRVRDASSKQQRAAWGLTRSLLANAVRGVSEGYTLPLRLVGVGYRAAVEPVPSDAGPRQRLNLKLGFAHPVLINLPADVQASTPSTTTIELSGIDKQRLGEVAARIRSWRVPEPYNGKGIFVGDEQVKRKEVKKK
ncbi:hypothetical protein JCM10212_001591 [Sporobolomyces blumeae]